MRVMQGRISQKEHRGRMGPRSSRVMLYFLAVQVSETLLTLVTSITPALPVAAAGLVFDIPELDVPAWFDDGFDIDPLPVEDWFSAEVVPVMPP